MRVLLLLTSQIGREVPMFNLGTFLTTYVEYRSLSIVDNYKSERHGEHSGETIGEIIFHSLSEISLFYFFIC